MFQHLRVGFKFRCVYMSGSRTRFSKYSIIVRQLSNFLDFELISTTKKTEFCCAMFFQITKMLLKTVFNSATAQQLMQLSEDLKNISCCGCLLGKIFKILRVRQCRILFISGQSVYNIRFIECYFVQITTKLLHMALNSLC